ncbi:pentatricopeptide repeat-containing protein [Prunus yedoensis var. nudiflora]|uniref:Pentatricopeptide repeat-containing protein n=1 Tax=Prunus yedoensis var. nudiflora TaxID=2094558 RepID=A0A314ZEQ4_PRUYE|nr:pentatricopeptide repeat-containing protein [Prunus yedoensis var. nudiflora]
MQRSGIEPNLRSDVLMLQSYLRSERISDALNFFNDLHQRREMGRRLYSTMIVGLCKVKRADIALDFLKEMREKGVVPSDDCYEFLIQLLCWNQGYHIAVNLINDLEKVGRHITSFTGNILLLHSLKSQELYEAWVQLRQVPNEKSDSSMLGLLIGAFSGRVRRLSETNMDRACALFNKMCQKGYEPNRWTYDTLVQGFLKHGRTSEARRWLEVMYRNRFPPTERTKLLI